MYHNLLGLPFGSGGIPPIQTPADARLGTLYRWHDTNTIGTLWQDSARTTPVAANNDPIGAWDDQSGNSHHLLQATSGSRPLYKATAWGTPSLKGDGVDDFMSQAVNIGSSYTMYMVGMSIRTLPGPSPQVDVFLAGGQGGTGIGLELYNSFGSTTELRFYGEFCTTLWLDGAVYTYPATVLTEHDHIWSAVNANTATSNTGTFLGHFDSSAYYCPCPIKCLLMYTAAHNAAQTALVHQWAMTPGRFNI